MTLSVVLITLNEEAKLPRTLASVLPLVRDGHGEIIVVDSGSTDRTVAIARSYGAKVFTEPWKGFAAQKNSAIAKATCDWVLQLDADEALEPELQNSLAAVLESMERCARLNQEPGARPLMLGDAQADVEKHTGAQYTANLAGFWIPRKNFFLGRWIKHGGFYPDPKLRLIRRGAGNFEEYGAHPTIQVQGPTGRFKHALIHDAYPTLRGYIDHMNSYSSLGASLAIEKGHRSFSLSNIVVRPWLTFIYNYFFRLGFLDGREGFLLHLYHAVYVSWKYSKAWEQARTRTQNESFETPSAAPD
ncbi:MAG TPA: glycosyltransferase family 2 protein [Terriglobales bacterium]|nr:glycosyltransferase family 2 protein [Terriglobales bacterium]